MNAPEPLGAQLTFELIAQLVREDKYHYSSQAEERMAERGITDVQVKETILTGRVLETYTDDARGWSYLVLVVPHGQPIHVQIGHNRYRGLAIIITLYVPEPPKWINPSQRGT
jgi:hypothetical protein